MAVKRHVCAIMKPTGVCALRDRAVVDGKKYCLNCVNMSMRECIYVSKEDEGNVQNGKFL